VNTYTLTTIDLNRRVVRQSTHRSIPNLYRTWTREQGRVHPEGRGPQKPWSGYVTIKRDDDGIRVAFDARQAGEATPRLFELE
jgi:hypothetical protein